MSSKIVNNDQNEGLTSKPLKSLNELYSNLKTLNSWPKVRDIREITDYVYSGKNINDVSKPLRKIPRKDRPKTLVCHDMKGGYLDDRFVNGSEAHDSYVFYHWNVIDSFVYFSHHLVTVPPSGWIDAAHLHGVKIFGTVITEWEDGEKIWQEIFQSESEIKRFADALIEVAKFHHFDGWLLNVENKIREEDVAKLKFFVEYLTENIHKELDNSEVIWYDSVTCKGELKWQNELNDLNKCFFDACDGIFLNYNWSESTLTQSRMKVVEENRVRDIYVGLDVWGRGCPGGGGFQSEYALRKIREQDLSVAIFAPGWTHEYFGPKTFEDTENLFWAQLVPHLYIHVPLYNNEAFGTSFCRGIGSANYRLGQRKAENEIAENCSSEKDAPFFNLSLQRPQISVPMPDLEFIIKPEVKEEKTAIESNLLNKNETEKPSALGDTQDPEGNPPEKEVKDVFYETKKSVIKIRGDTIIFREKTISPDLNYFNFTHSSSYNGGGCVELITEDPRLYHRLLLIEVTFDRGIQVSLTYHAGADSTEQDEPILVTADDNNIKLIRKYKTDELNFPWRRNLYSTKLKTITQIGVAVPKAGTITLGEIIVEEEEEEEEKEEEKEADEISLLSLRGQGKPPYSVVDKPGGNYRLQPNSEIMNSLRVF